MIEIIRDEDGRHWQKTLVGVMPCHIGALAKKYRKTTLTDAVKMLGSFSVETLEGTMEGKAGDYLMIGVNGEMYPCDADVFAKTYELAKEAA